MSESLNGDALLKRADEIAAGLGYSRKAMTPMEASFEKFVVDKTLVVTSQLFAWKKERPGPHLALTLAAESSLLNEDRWYEEVDHSFKHLVESHPTFPIPPLKGLCPSALNPLASDLWERGAAILSDFPVLLVGVVNPFDLEVVIGMLAARYSRQTSVIVLISPHAFAQAKELLDAKVSSPTADWSGESAVEWADQLFFASDTFVDAASIAESLWTNKPIIPVLWPQLMDKAASFRKDRFATILRNGMTRIWIATDTPTDHQFIDHLYQELKKQVRVIAVPPQTAKSLQLTFDATKGEELGSLMVQAPLVTRDWHPHEGREKELWDRLLETAIRMGASDLHLEPEKGKIRVRICVNRIFYEQAPIPIHFYMPLYRHIKVEAKMSQDIFLKEQEGYGEYEVDRVRHAQRYSTLPGRFHERLAVRFFSPTMIKLADLALPAFEREALLWASSLDNGMILCTGPTGSGKTTTLYSLIDHLRSPTRVILTAEAPPEKRIDDVFQVEVSQRTGLTFQAVIRNFMRQFPQIIMIGEMRDDPSVAAGFDAAQSGHLVLSTFHAYSAIGAIDRLKNVFKVHPVTMANSMRLITNHHLLPRLCKYCRRERKVLGSDLKGLSNVTVDEQKIGVKVGCPNCRDGYLGYYPITEALPIDSETIEMMVNDVPTNKIAERNRGRGFRSLAEQATEAMLLGEILPEDARRMSVKPMF